MTKQTISRRGFVKGFAASFVSLAGLGILNACNNSGGSAPAATTADPTTAAATQAATEAATQAAIEAANTAAKAAGMTFTPGTYEATAKGIASDVKVTMTFDETSIKDVKVDTSGETPTIGGKIADDVAKSILDGQTADIDAIAGATVTTDAVKKAAADCISQASGQEVALSEDAATDADWLGTKPEISDSDITEELSTKLLIVGLGTGGWPAALAAADAGIETLVIEKKETPTNVREDIGGIGSKWQLESIKTMPNLAIDKMEAMEDIVRYGTGYVDYNLIKLWANESGELVNWIGGILEDSGKYYMQHEAGVGDTRYQERDKAYATGHSPHKKDEFKDDKSLTTSAVFTDYCNAKGNVTFKFSTALVELIQDESGKVTGVIAQDQTDQHYVKITADNVLMATGGYATNTAMMNALQPMTQEMKVQCTKGSTCDGSGIKAMLWAGGQMDPIHESMMFNRCCMKPDETAGYKTSGEWFWFGEQPFLKVNLKGERFCNESGPYEFMLHSMEMQPHHTYCDIFDANNKQYTEQFQEVGCCRLWPFDNGALMNRDYDGVWKSNEELIEKGYIVKADTLEDLAKGLNIPVDTFVATVERYNELCAKGEDEDYGKAPHRMTPVDTAPFYGVRTAAWHLTTLDGIRINTNMQVIDKNGDPIEGLYATGDCSGGFFANNYPNLFTGLACGRTMTFARHAVNYIAGL
ncbi:succinate dehydrogenase/fumarate reductase flavoprotein subunit [Lachnospiraceae bacterium JC7]|nr:succinate dehydrogenase/fumarate reductase flavoprotein subunit [Lachnospiraceae bacterium JC7]